MSGKDWIVEVIAGLSAALDDHAHLVLCRFNSAGELSEGNRAARALGGPESPDNFSIRGHVSAAMWERWSSLAPEELFRGPVEFTATAGIPTQLDCVVRRELNGFCLLGVPSAYSQSEIFSSLAASHSEVLNLYRDVMRQKAELEAAHDRIRVLRGLIPICASCKNIRNDQGYWSRIEEFISEHSEAEFSHGLCPDCLQKLYPDED